jgi:hypothetical protein
MMEVDSAKELPLVQNRGLKRGESSSTVALSEDDADLYRRMKSLER